MTDATPDRSDRFVSRDGEFQVTLSPEQQQRRDALRERKRRGGRRAASARGQRGSPLPLAQLRAAEGRTQAELAQALGISRPAIVRLEHQDDLLLSTLRAYVHELGGHVEVVLGDQRIPLSD